MYRVATPTWCFRSGKRRRGCSPPNAATPKTTRCAWNRSARVCPRRKKRARGARLRRLRRRSSTERTLKRSVDALARNELKSTWRARLARAWTYSTQQGATSCSPARYPARRRGTSAWAGFETTPSIGKWWSTIWPPARNRYPPCSRNVNASCRVSAWAASVRSTNRAGTPGPIGVPAGRRTSRTLRRTRMTTGWDWRRRRTRTSLKIADEEARCSRWNPNGSR